MAEKVLLTVPEAAERLGLGRTMVYGLISSGRLRSVSIGRARRIPVDAIIDFVSGLDGNEVTTA